MAKRVVVRNLTRGGKELVVARWCSSFGCRLRGLTFRRGLPMGEALLLVEGDTSRVNAAIHMWGVFIPLGVAWLDDALRVVDTRLALPWRFYLPAAPARYILEADPSMLDGLAPGDVLEFADAPPA